MRNVFKALTALSLVFVFGLTSACENIRGREKELGGTIVGAGLGALAGSHVGSGKGQLAAVAIGTLAGAWLGNEVGKSLDRMDRIHAERSAQYALEKNPTGTKSYWKNPDSGNSGAVTPMRPYRSASGQDCRDFEHTVVIDGKRETVYGRACRGNDEVWRVVQ